MEETTWIMFVHVKELETLINYKLNICQHYDVSAEKKPPQSLTA